MAVRTEIERKLTGRMAASSQIFLWLAAAGIIGALAAFAYTQRWFTPTIHLYFYAPTAAHLNRGMAVRLAGFNVGSLEQVSLVGETRVKAKVVMDRRYRDSVDKDARIRLTKEGLLGAYVLELFPGQGDQGPVENDSVLTYERDLDYSAAVTGLVDRIGPVLDDIRAVTSRLGDPEAGIHRTLRYLDEAIVALTDMSRGMNKLAADGSRLAADGSRLAADGSRLTRDMPARLEPVIEDVRRSLAQFEAMVKHLNERLPPIVEETHRSLQSVRAASDSAQRVIAEDVPRVLRRSEVVLEDTDEILGGVRRSWPVRNMLPPAEEKVIELDSADGAGHARTGGKAP